MYTPRAFAKNNVFFDDFFILAMEYFSVLDVQWYEKPQL